MVCYDKIEVLPIKYNMQIASYCCGFESFKKEFGEKQDINFRYNNTTLYEGYYHPVNLHYSGYTKPWSKESLKLREYWWYYANKTKYMSEIMEMNNYDKNEINEMLSKINFKNITENIKPE